MTGQRLMSFPWGGPRPRKDTIVPEGALVPYPVAQVIVSRQFLWLRKCPGCQRVRAYQADNKTCSGSCGKVLVHWRRPDQERRMRRLQKLALAVRRRKQEERWARLAEGLTPAEAFGRAYRLGYNAGLSTVRVRQKRSA